MPVLQSVLASGSSLCQTSGPSFAVYPNPALEFLASRGPRPFTPLRARAVTRIVAKEYIVKQVQGQITTAFEKLETNNLHQRLRIYIKTTRAEVKYYDDAICPRSENRSWMPYNYIYKRENHHRCTRLAGLSIIRHTELGSQSTEPRRRGECAATNSYSFS